MQVKAASKTMATRIPSAVLTLLLVITALTITACGGGDDETTTTEANATDGAEGGASYDVTVEEFVAALEPEKAKMMEDFAEDNPQDCKALEVDESLTLLSVRALDTPPDTPLPEFLLDHCKALP